MLTDEQIQEIAVAHVKRTAGDLSPSRPVKLDDPAGVFYKVDNSLKKGSTNLIAPFFVMREDGRIITVSAGQVMPGIVTKLWGWAAMRADPELQSAVIDPDFSKPRHLEVWGAIVRECMNEPKK